MKRTIGLVFPAILAVSGCGSNPPPPPAPPVVPVAAVLQKPMVAPADALGPKPEVLLPPPYIPPAPVVYTSTNGLTVWLVERHGLPVVSFTMVIPNGSANDPKGAGGLAFATAGMLDEGAGKLGAIELAKAVDTLGATVRTAASLDFSSASLTVLKRNLTPAFALFGDVVARPRFDANEWKRVHDLWQNDLKARASEPDAVSAVVSLAALYGSEHPYGHPTDGTVASSAKVQLKDVKSFYASAWRPERATLVVVGDINRAELEPLLLSSFTTWKPSPTAPPPPPIVTPPPPPGPLPRVVMVDRPDAPQSVLAFVKLGVAASDQQAPPLARVNGALGGSFTSRLNQDLREEHGWSYGARSRLTFSRGPGSLVASAAVYTEKTGEALQAMLADIADYSKTGPTVEETQKTRLQSRSELVEMFEQVDTSALRLARNAALGLGPEFEAKASVRRDTATREELAKLAGTVFSPANSVLVIVGPRAKLAPVLSKLGFPAPEMRDAEGERIP